MVTFPGCRVVLVTGASSGIGRECALAFARRGDVGRRRRPPRARAAGAGRRAPRDPRRDLRRHLPCRARRSGAARARCARPDRRAGQQRRRRGAGLPRRTRGRRRRAGVRDQRRGGRRPDPARAARHAGPGRRGRRDDLVGGGVGVGPAGHRVLVEQVRRARAGRGPAPGAAGQRGAGALGQPRADRDRLPRPRRRTARRSPATRTARSRPGSRRRGSRTRCSTRRTPAGRRRARCPGWAGWCGSRACSRWGRCSTWCSAGSAGRSPAGSAGLEREQAEGVPAR